MNRTGKIRSVLLRTDHDNRLTELCDHLGVNRNQLIRHIAVHATVEELQTIVDRNEGLRL